MIFYIIIALDFLRPNRWACGSLFYLKLILKNKKEGRRKNQNSIKSNSSQTNSTAGEVNSDGNQETKFAQDKVNEFIQ